MITTLEIPPTNVQIGGDEKKNCIEISVKNTKSAETCVTVTVGCGPQGKDLLSSKNVTVNAKCALNGGPPVDLGLNKVSDGRSWLVKRKAVTGLTITLKDFKCDTQPGTAEITVLHQVMSPAGVWEPASTSLLKVTKELVVPKNTSELCYFRVDPDYILHAGSTKVVVSFLATGYDEAFLFRNNEEVKQEEWSEEGVDGGPDSGTSGTDYKVTPADCSAKLKTGLTVHFKSAHSNTTGSEPTLAYCGDKGVPIKKNGRKPLVDGDIVKTRTQHYIFDGDFWALQDPATDKIVMGYFTDTPSITSVYRLLLKGTPPGKAKESQEFWRTVQVISSGWNRVSLPQGSPTRLFAAVDFKENTSPTLYGIFYRSWYQDPEKKSGLNSEARLYSSANGVDKWEDLGPLPDEMKGMETSPGVYYKSRLWLIGGSAVDDSPAKMRKDIWCYQQVSEDKWEWKPSGLQFPPVGKSRFGHSCIVFNKEIWVLGGYDQGGKPHNDIWRIAGNNDQFSWVNNNNPEHAAWEPRCLHTSAVVIAGGKQTLWVYGGAAGPTGKGFVDLWCKPQGADWKDGAAAIVPDPGRPLGSALLAYADDAGRADQRLMLLGSFVEWRPDKTPSHVGLELAGVGNRISSFHFEWQERKERWESSPVAGGWQQFEGENYSMQTIAFNGFIYIYTLDWKAIYPTVGDELVHLKLNIRVP